MHSIDKQACSIKSLKQKFKKKTHFHFIMIHVSQYCTMKDKIHVMLSPHFTVTVIVNVNTIRTQKYITYNLIHENTFSRDK